MEPEFQRAMIFVLVGGTLVIAIGTIVLLLAFRAAKNGRPPHVGLIGGLVAFIFLCCLILFFLSYAGEH